MGTKLSLGDLGKKGTWKTPLLGRWLLISLAKPVKWSLLLLKLQKLTRVHPSLTIAQLNFQRDLVSGADRGWPRTPPAPH